MKWLAAFLLLTSTAHAQGSVLLQAAYPANALPVTASATGTTGAVTATLPASTGLTWLCGFSVRANATAATTGSASIQLGAAGTQCGFSSGFSSGFCGLPITLTFAQFTAANSSGVGIATQTFFPCLQSGVRNSPITVTSAAPGAGGNVSVSAWGFQQ